MTRRDNEAGFTLLEMTVSLSVFIIGMGILLVTFDRGGHFTTQANALARADSSAQRSTNKLMDLFSEASRENIDTMARYRSAVAAVSFSTDRFWTNSMRQCGSANCGFHTRNDLSVDAMKYSCAHEYRRGLGTVPSAMGKVWSANAARCAFDGSGLASGANMDGVRLLVARSDGAFRTNQGRPLFRNMVFVFPKRNDKGLMDLARYELRIEDLIAAGVSTGGGWDRWTNADLDWFDLLDFGTDGTIDAVPDGSVPLTAENSDGAEEMFSTMTTNDGPGVIYNKVVGVWGATYRKVTVTVRLDTGRIDFDIEHYDTSFKFWSVSGQITRAPEVLVNDVTEFAVSTAVSNPLDPVTNPTGVAQDGIVRVHIGTSRNYRRDGNELWEHHVDTFTVRPRN